MPTVNIYQSSKEFEHKLKLTAPKLKELIAKELSGESIKLGVDEVSVRIINVVGEDMLGKVELEIHAAAFEERVKKQDEICLKVKGYLEDMLNTRVNVWLVLCELGHSWQNT